MASVMLSLTPQNPAVTCALLGPVLQMRKWRLGREAELLSGMVRTKSQVRPTPNPVLPSSGLAATTLTNTILLWANLQVQVPQGEVDSNTRLQLWLWQAVAVTRSWPLAVHSVPHPGDTFPLHISHSPSSLKH